MNSTQKKSTFFSVLFLAVVIISNAQSHALSKIYLQGGIGGASYHGFQGDLGLQAIIKNKWSTTLSYQSLSMTPKNEPSDYRPATGVVFFVPFTDEVKTNMSIVNLTAGRYFKLGRNIWATTEGGLSYVSGEKVSFQRTEVTGSNIIIFAETSSNYNTYKERQGSLGAAFKADVNWGFSSFMGLGCSVFANVNSIQSPVGFQVNLLVGYMGKEKKNRRSAAL